jgi:GMP synthase (glutamine-hydrolysing)
VPSGSADTVVVLDFGSQYTQLIARRIREARVRSVVLPFDTPAADVAAYSPKGIILSGGPSSVYDEGAPLGDGKLFELGAPVLGLCYGMMWIASATAEGRPPGRELEHIVAGRGRLFRGLARDDPDEPGRPREAAPPAVTATTKRSGPPRIRPGFYGIQGIEVHYLSTAQISRTSYDVCGAKPSWTMAGFRDATVARSGEIREGASRRASGGVDPPSRRS